MCQILYYGWQSAVSVLCSLELKALVDSNCIHVILSPFSCFHCFCRSGNDVCHYCGAEWKDKKATCSCPLSDGDNSLDDEDDRYIEEDEDDEDEDYDDDDYQSEDEEENEVGGQEYENEDESGSIVGEEEEVQEGQIQEQVLEKDIENHILSDEVDYFGEEEEEEDDEEEEEDFNNDEYQSEDEEENEVGGKDEVHEGQIQEDVLEKGTDDCISSDDVDRYYDDEYEEDEEDYCDSDSDF